MKLINNYNPFLYQLETIENLKDILDINNAAFLWDETGLGKTITSLTTDRKRQSIPGNVQCQRRVLRSTG